MKKKIMGMFLLLFIAGGFLTGCSSETGSASSAEKKEEEVVDTSAIDEYRNTMQDSFANMGDYMGTFAAKSSEAGEDYTLMYNESWVMEMVTALVGMDQEIEVWNGIEEVPEEYKETHDLLLKAGEEFKYVTENYPKAIDNMDLDLMTECLMHMSNGNVYLGEATEKMPK
jgi:hypothetical protein